MTKHLVLKCRISDTRYEWKVTKLEKEDRQVIKSVIKSQNGMVMVFGKRGEQIPEYQGQYEEVRKSILKDAPPDAVFGYFPNCETELEMVPREKW